MCTFTFTRIQERFYVTNVHGRLGLVVITNIVIHFCINCVNTISHLKSVPDDKTWTRQQWNVPSEFGNTGAVSFFDISFIEADSEKKRII